jgi:hypothetical protein
MNSDWRHIEISHYSNKCQCPTTADPTRAETLQPSLVACCLHMSLFWGESQSSQDWYPSTLYSTVYTTSLTDSWTTLSTSFRKAKQSVLLRKITDTYRVNHTRYTNTLRDKVQCLLMLQQMVHIITPMQHASAWLSTKKCGNSHLTHWYSRCEAPGTCNAAVKQQIMLPSVRGKHLNCVRLQTVQRTVSMATLQLAAVYPSTHTSS